MRQLKAIQNKIYERRLVNEEGFHRCTCSHDDPLFSGMRQQKRRPEDSRQVPGLWVRV